MKIKMIVAVDAEYGIGKDGKLPWHIPQEFKYFSDYTKSNMCIMGRKTYEDIKGFKKVSDGEFLPKRSSLVITSEIKRLRVANTYDSIVFTDDVMQLINMLEMAKKNTKNNVPDICIIGGKSIYELFMKQENLVDEVSVTYINDTFKCDTFIDLNNLLKGFTPTRTIKMENEPWEVVIYQKGKS